MNTNKREPARVCLIAEKCFPDSRGGMELHAHELAGQLTRHGGAALVVTRFQHPGSAAAERVGGVDVRRLRPRGRPQSLGWRAVVPNVAALIGFFFWLVHHGQRYDVLLVHSTKFLLLPVLAAARLRRRPCVVKVDTLLHLQEAISAASLGRMRLPGRRWLARSWGRVRAALLRRADAIVAVTEEMRGLLVSMGVAEARILLIPNGIDMQRFAPVSAERQQALRVLLGLPAERILVLCSGRLAVSKGVLDLLAAWRTIADEHPCAHLVFAGSGSHSADDCEDELRAMIRAAGLEASITLAGEVANVHEYLQAADLFVMPSHSEGFCLALVEAMACGLPVISTRTGVASEVIVEGESGMLAAPHRPEELARAIAATLEHPERWHDLGSRARAAVESRFAMPQIARAYEALFACLRRAEAEVPVLRFRKLARHGAGTTVSSKFPKP